MAGFPLLDANPILRHVLDDHADHSARSHALFARIEAGAERMELTDTVIFEAAFTLERFYKVPRIGIRTVLLAVLELPGLVLAGKQAYRRVFDLDPKNCLRRYSHNSSWTGSFRTLNFGQVFG